MQSPFSLSLAVLAVLLSASVLIQSSMADTKEGDHSASGSSSISSFKIDIKCKTIHTGAHSALCTGASELSFVVTDQKPGTMEPSPMLRFAYDPDINHPNAKIIWQSLARAHAWYRQTLVGDIQLLAMPHPTAKAYPSGTNHKDWFQLSAETVEGWTAIVEAHDGTLEGKYRTAEASPKKVRTHKKGEPPGDITGVLPPGTPPNVTALITDVRDGGSYQFAYDSNGDVVLDANDAFTFALDAAGEYIIDVPVTTWLRLTSSVTMNAADDFVYTYSLENLSDQDLAFRLDEVTTPAFPTGWSGSVEAESTETLTMTVVSPEAVWRQTCQVDYREDPCIHQETIDNDWWASKPASVYVPQSRLSYDGEPTLTGAAYDPGLAANVVTFTITGDAADVAVLDRLDPGGDGVSVVTEAEGPFLPGIPYTLNDVDFVSGATNTYRVRVGIGPNGQPSDDASVQN